MANDFPTMEWAMINYRNRGRANREVELSSSDRADVLRLPSSSLPSPIRPLSGFHEISFGYDAYRPDVLFLLSFI